ncbi:hypothetical protein T12_14719, partial [Trichinella patagoniensis]
LYYKNEFQVQMLLRSRTLLRGYKSQFLYKYSSNGIPFRIFKTTCFISSPVAPTKITSFVNVFSNISANTLSYTVRP